MADKLKNLLRKLPAAPAQFLPSMLLKPVSALPEGEQWQYELKFDGFRCQVVKDGDRVSLVSRQANHLGHRFPGLVESARELTFRSGVIDGEIVALQDDGRPSFQLLQNHASAGCNVVFYGFDLLNLEGRRTTGFPLTLRRHMLETVLASPPSCFLYSRELKGEPERLVSEVRRLKLEGIVAKRRSSLYLPGRRSDAWLKYKVEQEGEFVIGGYTLGAHPFDSLLVGRIIDGRLMYCGKVRAGFVAHTRTALFASIKGRTVKGCPFANLPQKSGGPWGDGLTAADMAKCVWVMPARACRVGFVECTEAGQLRHPRFLSAA